MFFYIICSLLILTGTPKKNNYVQNHRFIIKKYRCIMYLNIAIFYIAIRKECFVYE